MTDLPRCCRCGCVLDPEARCWSVTVDPVTGAETVLTACLREHVNAVHEETITAEAGSGV